MREYKFRAYDNKNKKWLLGYDYPNLGGFSLFGECMLLGQWANTFDKFLFEKDGLKWEDLKVMQFTGLKDQKEIEVYEGDIIACFSGSDKIGEKDIVEFKYGCFWLRRRHTSIYNLIEEFNVEIKVIGNIFDNSELTK